MTTVHFKWKSGWLGGGSWEVLGVPDRKFDAHQPWLPWRRPKPLFYHDSEKRFRAFLQKNAFFHGYCLGLPDGALRRFRFVFHGGRETWSLPWELLLGDFRNEDLGQVVITRGDGLTEQQQPHRFTKALRVQIILGENSGKWGPELDFGAELEAIHEAHRGLEEASRNNVELLQAEQPSLSEIGDLLRRSTPDILWFSGHSKRRGPAFCLRSEKEGDRPIALTPRLLAEAIRDTGVRPLYLIFQACHLGSPTEAASMELAPAFFSELVGCGVQGMLLMQGPILDLAAVRLASSLFRGLATGMPLDRAVASARGVLRLAMSRRPEGAKEWARPAVWSHGVPPGELKFEFPGSEQARWQVTALQALRASQTAPGDLDGGVDPRLLSHAREWLELSPPRLLLIGDADNADILRQWIGLLLSFLNLTPRPLIGVDLRGQHVEPALRAWAEQLASASASWYEPFFQASGILDSMKADPQATWPILCANEEIDIAVRDTSSRDLPGWFLLPLEQRSKGLTLLLRSVPVTEDWPAMESMDLQAQDAGELAVQAVKFTALFQAMAVVGVPVREKWLRDTQLSANLKAEIGPALIETTAGYVLKASTSARVAQAMDEDQRLSAHANCMRILDQPDLRARMTVPLRMLRLRHCLKANDIDAAILESKALLYELREDDLPWRAIEVEGLIKFHQRYLPGVVSLHLAWARIMTGDIGTGKVWLTLVKGLDSPLEEAWYHGLRAEVAKSRGEKTEALREIDRAIECIRRAEGSDDAELVRKRLLAYRQDRARILQYLFYDDASAIAEFKAVLEEFGDSDRVVLRAIVNRNLSEALRRHARNSGVTDLTNAKEILDESIASLAAIPEVPVYAELLYERAGIALLEGDRAALDSYLEKCLVAATRGRHWMLHAIAMSKHFWELEAFDLARWKSIETPLRAYPRHGWAVRVAMRGRLKAAGRVAATQPAAAIELLQANLASVRANPGFDGRSDRRCIATSYAGIAVISGDLAPWNQFLAEQAWAAEWLASQEIEHPEELWKGV